MATAAADASGAVPRSGDGAAAPAPRAGEGCRSSGVNWPRRAVLGLLAGFAVVADALELVRPEESGRTGPAMLALATVVVAVLVLRHSRRIDPVAMTTWRGFGVIA